MAGPRAFTAKISTIVLMSMLAPLMPGNLSRWNTACAEETVNIAGFWITERRALRPMAGSWGTSVLALTSPNASRRRNGSGSPWKLRPTASSWSTRRATSCWRTSASKNCSVIRRQELIGQAVELLVPERFRSDHLAHRAGFHAAPVARAMGAGRELFARRKDGTEFPVEIGISPIQSPEGTLVLSVIVDITERKQAEAEARQHREEVAHLSRLAIMGEMAGSLAHELNQPLGAIVTNVGAALRFLERDNLSGEKLRELLQDIAADGKRAGDVIRTVKGIGRKEAGARRLLQLNEVIAEVLRLVRSDALAHDCTVLTELHPAPPKVEANSVQLQEVFLNLILNAFEASKDVPRAQRRIIIRTEPDGDSAVRASVRDFGTGLPADLPERVFDRFFSTKRGGHGYRLVHCAVNRCRARRHALRGECGGGWSRVLLATPGLEGDWRMTPAHRLVCVVDDDLSMRKAVGRLLESEDYAVEIFTGAQEFLARVPHTGPSCVILDLNMPGLNGLELQETLAQKGRAEQLIFITGGASVPTCVQAMKAGRGRLSAETFPGRGPSDRVERALEAVFRAMASARGAQGCT